MSADRHCLAICVLVEAFSQRLNGLPDVFFAVNQVDYKIYYAKGFHNINPPFNLTARRERVTIRNGNGSAVLIVFNDLILTGLFRQ